MMVLAVVYVIGLWSPLLWLAAVIVSNIGRVVSPRLSRTAGTVRLARILWYPAGPGFLIGAEIAGSALIGGRDGFFAGLTLVCCAYGLRLWWAHRDWPDHDGRWKRRRKAAADAVRRMGHRLAVVPS